MTIEAIKNASDQELMSLLAEDNLAAWSEIVKRHTRTVFSISNQILKNASDAEDSVQNTFIRLKMYAKNFDSSLPLKPWLSRIASGEAIRIYNRKKNITQKESARMQATENSLGSQRKPISSKLEQEELDAVIRGAIARLPELTRLAITLYYIGGMNQKEIAKELGVSQFSISEKINYGLDKIQGMLKRSEIFASIAISPFLLERSLLPQNSVVELAERIAKELPSTTQIAQMEPLTLNLTSKPIWGLKIKVIGLFVLLALMGVVIKFYFPQKKLTTTIATIHPPVSTILTKDINIKKIVAKNDFSTMSFDNYIPITCKFSTPKPNPSKRDLFNEEIQISNNQRNWMVVRNQDQQEVIVRENSNDQLDGFYVDSKFDKPYLFTGKIIFKDTSLFSFLLSSGLKKDSEAPLVDNADEHSMMFRHAAIASHMKSEKGSEIRFLIYVWPHKDNLISTVFVSAKGLPETRLVIKSMHHYNVNFRLGFLSNGQNEISELKACALERDWDFRKDEDLKHFLDKFPPSYFE